MSIEQRAWSIALLDGKNRVKQLLICLALCAVLFALCASVEAQPPATVSRIGYLSNSHFPGSSYEAFRQGLRDLGYFEGKNIAIEQRLTKGKIDRLPVLAAELAGLGMDCIYTLGVEPTLAARRATSTIPIVMGDADDDPVRLGLVTSLARPGGNITGFISISSDLTSKRLELLKEVVPNLSRVAILYVAQSRAAEGHLRESQIAARELGMDLQPLPIKGPDDLENSFQIARKQRVQGFLIVNVAGMSAYQPKIRDLAIKARLPTMHTQSERVAAGGLMSYSADILAIRRGAATYIERILKGVKPAELPVQQPTKFELVVI